VRIVADDKHDGYLFSVMNQNGHVSAIYTSLVPWFVGPPRPCRTVFETSPSPFLAFKPTSTRYV